MGSGPEDYISKGLKIHDEFRSIPEIQVAFGPHAPYTVSDKPLERICVLAEEMDAPIQIHLHETATEVEQALAATGKRPSERLFELGLLGPRTQCVHMTQVNDRDLELLANTQSHVIHCPESNLKLASGFCPVSQLQSRGINVAIGTDGAASNNDLSLLAEVQTASLLAKTVANDATALSAFEALEMATLNGAKALGIDDLVGTLEVGKQADIAAFEFAGPLNQPVFNPVSHWAYANRHLSTSHVWVNGKSLLWQGQLTRIDLENLSARVGTWQRRLSQPS